MNNKTLHLEVNGYNKTVDYGNLEPSFIAGLHFEYIKQLKKLKKKAESSLYTESKMFPYLLEFMKKKNIDSFVSFKYATLQEFTAYLSTALTKDGRPLSKSSQRLAYTFFKSFAKWLYDNHREEAPSLNIFHKSPYRGINNDLKTTFFPDMVLDQIKKALKDEPDIYTKAYILISFYYGLRSVDIVNLKTNCLVISSKDGKYDFHYIDHKQKENVVIPAIAAPVVKAISNLMHLTHDIRVKYKTEYVFIKEDAGKLHRFKPYQKNLLDKFVRTHKIVDENGHLIKMTSHIFRRTLATNMQSQGTSLEATQSILNHKHKRTTLQHYIKTKNEDYIEQITTTLEHMNILASTTSLSPVSVDLGVSIRLSDGYCTNDTMLKDKDYICETFKKRGNCYGCSKMVTTPEFLPYFKNLVKDKEEELEIKGIYGSHVIRQIEFEKELIQALILKLEEIAER